MYQKGQYFTTNEYLKDCVFNLILNKPSLILEPSIGQGDLVEYVMKRNQKIEFQSYEIDNNIKLLDSISNVIYADFLTEIIEIKYDTIIGNPPYIKTKTGNIYLDFIYKCYNLLNEKGELIFIVPSDFIKLTSASKIINKMLEDGTFTHIIHPNNENLFSHASIDVIIFRYCRDRSLSNKILVNNEEKYLINTDGIITFSDIKQTNCTKFAEYFDIFVGMVTGKESVYKNDKFGNIKILNGKNKEDKYILIHNFPTDNVKLNNYMLSNKEVLMARKIRKFNEKNWFEWGAPRNIRLIEEHMNKKCIYISNMTRKHDVAFVDTVKYFGGGLIILIPHKNIDLCKFVGYLNSDKFKSNYMYSGRFKIGHKQLCNSLFNVPTYI